LLLVFYVTRSYNNTNGLNFLGWLVLFLIILTRARSCVHIFMFFPEAGSSVCIFLRDVSHFIVMKHVPQFIFL